MPTKVKRHSAFTPEPSLAPAAATDVGFYIQSVMSKNGWSLRDVAERGAELNKPFSYEHLRKILKGTTTPSPDLLERIAKALDIDPDLLVKIQVKTSVTRQYGREYLSALGVTEEMYEMDKLMKLLTQKQRDMVMDQIRALVNGNAAHGTVHLPRSGHRRRA